MGSADMGLTFRGIHQLYICIHFPLLEYVCQKTFEVIFLRVRVSGDGEIYALKLFHRQLMRACFNSIAAVQPCRNLTAVQTMFCIQ